ncbi:MAG: capsular polysaccharide synthesis protein [Rickettsiales bacterium]|jgi:hypothetical protein|nr:capsular polysaccharide synthesis protein [Rickettsiales bacterium]
MTLVGYKIRRIGTALANLVCGFIPSKRWRNVVRDLLDPFSPPHVEAYLARKYVARLPKLLKKYPPEKGAAKGGCRLVFQFWRQGAKNAPPIVKSCLASVKKFVGDRQVVLDGNSISKWVNIPDFVLEKRARGKIGEAAFSDVLRIALLARHGGIWLDATNFMTAPMPKFTGGFFAYRTAGPAQWSVYGSCVLYAKQGDYIVKAMRALLFEYWRCEPVAVQYLYLHLMLKALVKNDPRAKKEIEAMPVVQDKDPIGSALYRPWNRGEFARLSAVQPLHKLTWKLDLSRLPGTIAEHIIKGGNNEK